MLFHRLCRSKSSVIGLLCMSTMILAMDEKHSAARQQSSEEKRYQEERKKKEAEVRRLEQEFVINAQRSLNVLFERAVGDVAAQFRLLRIVQEANTDPAQQKKRDILIILQQNPENGTQDAFAMLQGLIESGDWLEGRKIIRWNNYWQQEGKVHKITSFKDYEKLSALLEPWQDIMAALNKALARPLSLSEKSKVAPILLQLLTDKVDQRSIIAILSEYIAEIRTPKREQPSDDVSRFGGL